MAGQYNTTTQIYKPSNVEVTASPFQVYLSAAKTSGDTHAEGLKQESADKTSELLMLNHARYHSLFNEVGLHNHIVHHLLALWALGASPSEAQTAYDNNKGYQAPTLHHRASLASSLKDSATFKQYLGNTEHYSDFLKFFQDEIAARSVPDVVNEYVFDNNEKANDFMERMFSGFLHPIIHLGYGIEFNQPCIVAESLAAAAIHQNTTVLLIKPLGEYLSTNPSISPSSLLSIINDLRDDSFISNAVKPSDPPDRVTGGLFKRATQQLLPYLAKWKVKATQEDINQRTAEIINVCAYISGGAQHPGKAVAMEFFMMHSTNTSVFLPAIMKQDWISLEAKKKLLEVMGWMTCALYAANGCPTLYPERIRQYKPKQPSNWDQIIRRAIIYNDDGHTAKLIRALLNAEKVSKAYANDPKFPLKGDDFLQVAHMTMDSVERLNEQGYKIPEKVRKTYVEGLGTSEQVVKIIMRFVRWCGVEGEGAWDYVPDLDEQARL